MAPEKALHMIHAMRLSTALYLAIESEVIPQGQQLVTEGPTSYTDSKKRAIEGHDGKLTDTRVLCGGEILTEVPRC